MADEDEGEGELASQALDELQDLRLDHHIEGRGRLIADHQLGVAGKRHGDHRPLAHAAAHLVGELHQALGADADQVEELPGPRQGRLLGEVFMEDDRLGDLLADLDHRV